MQTFLHTLVTELLKEYGSSIGDVCIITPNRRARLFIRKAFEEQSHSIHWFPEILSLDEFVQQKTGLIPLDNIQLLVLFYKVYKQEYGEAAESFDSFLDWASEAISEFNDIDMALADPHRLFNHLSEARAIEMWHPDHPELTQNEKKFLDRYKSLLPLYLAFKRTLLSESLAYPGMVFRAAAEAIGNIPDQDSSINLVFAGFNALTPAEEKIIKTAVRTKKAKIYWDADRYYMDDGIQEAGVFLRKHRLWDTSFSFLIDAFKNDDKKITITGTPKRLGQAEQTGIVLSKIPKEELSKTCVVLAAEDLLLPVLHALPDTLETFNITMGYPLKTSLFATFTYNLFDIHQKSLNSEKYSDRFYHKSVVRLLNHPWLSLMKDKNKDTSDNELTNRAYLSKDDIAGYLEKNIPEFHTEIISLFEITNTPVQLLQSLSNVFKSIETYFNEHAATDSTNAEILKQGILQLDKLINVLLSSGLMPQTDTCRKLLMSLFNHASISFLGEPLQGLQIMGVLETRTLDFKNVIFAGVNENTLPKSEKRSRLIPLDIRREYKLSTYQDRDAIYAYHFYRLMQRSKNIWIIYNTSRDNLGEGERSRFVNQLLYEFPKYNQKIIIQETIAAQKPDPSQLRPDIIEITKTSDILDKLSILASQKGFSPSALQCFADCSLKFYFRYLESLKPLEEAEEEADSRGIGNIIHKSLEDFYKEFISKPLHKDRLESKLVKIDEIVNESFRQEYPNLNTEQGMNLIWLNTSKNLVNRYLSNEILWIDDLEKQHQSASILALETWLTASLSLPDGLDVIISGKADRIDLVNGVLEIIDYKSGIVKTTELGAWDFFLNSQKHKVPSQLLIYGWMAAKDNNYSNYPVTAICAGLRKNKHPRTKLKFFGSEIITNEILDCTESFIKEFVLQMFNKEENFVQTTDLNICQYCDFKPICKR